jgi:lipid II:glycine glycyltransferase (peptidoglycan interpeptide bridge formation enzyme)
MAMPEMRQLDPGYTSEVDTVDEATWCRILGKFADANIYQTWPYSAVTSSGRNVSHLILRKNGEIIAAAQARIAKLPLISVGIAYVRWGPLWRHTATATDEETFRQAIRALRNEFSCKRGLVLRLFPIVYDNDPPSLTTILAEEGFSSVGAETRSRTILMDINPPLETLRQGMNSHWKRELKLAERNRLEVVEGSDDGLFGMFIEIYREMVSRKRFSEGNDINQFRLMQAQLPENLKMNIMLCKSEQGICAGVVYSAVGNTALYLFGATSNVGKKSNGSYLLQWRLIEKAKEAGRTVYDLNGINPAKNPGTYKFKNDLAGQHGRDVHFVGRFDSHASFLSHACIQLGDKLKAIQRSVNQRIRTGRDWKLLPKATN